MNKTAIFALGLIVALASYTQFSKSYSSSDLGIPLEVSNMFQSWIVKHGKNYKTPEELLHRLKIFYDNYLYITESNKNNQGGAILGLNKFADLHVEEFLPVFLPGIKNAGKLPETAEERSKTNSEELHAEKAQTTD